jgi:hypothetical protein
VIKEVIQSKIGLRESRNGMSSASHGRRNNIINVLKPRRRIRRKFQS